MSYTLPIVLGAVGLLLLVALAVRALVMVRRFGAVTTAVTGRLGDRSEALRGRATALGAEIARRKCGDRTEMSAETKTTSG